MGTVSELQRVSQTQLEWAWQGERNSNQLAQSNVLADKFNQIAIKSSSRVGAVNA